MRASIAIAALLVSFGSDARAQDAVQSEERLILDADRRQAAIRSALASRREYFLASSFLDGCSLAYSLGDSVSFEAELQRLFGPEVRGSAKDGCVSEAIITRDNPSEVVYFRRLKHERNELITTHAGVAPRQSGLIVFEIVARQRSKSVSRVEQWVLREARPGVWAVETIRIFGFTHS